MKPPDKKFPHANGAGQQPARPSAHAQQFKPAVAQTKSALPAQAQRRPVAPPAYMPQPQPKVLQTKTAQGQQPNAIAQRVATAPRVYRPQPPPRCMQPKASDGKQSPLQKQSSCACPTASCHCRRHTGTHAPRVWAAQMKTAAPPTGVQHAPRGLQTTPAVFTSPLPGRGRAVVQRMMSSSAASASASAAATTATPALPPCRGCCPERKNDFVPETWDGGYSDDQIRQAADEKKACEAEEKTLTGRVDAAQLILNKVRPVEIAAEPAGKLSKQQAIDQYNNPARWSGRYGGLAPGNWVDLTTAGELQNEATLHDQAKGTFGDEGHRLDPHNPLRFAMTHLMLGVRSSPICSIFHLPTMNVNDVERHAARRRERAAEIKAYDDERQDATAERSAAQLRKTKVEARIRYLGAVT